MSNDVIQGSEIILNSVRYKLTSRLVREFASVFPQKTVIGDYSKSSDPYVDTWVISDQRGGILKEEMDEEKDSDRAYFSTCNLGHKGHIFLPSLATLVTMPVHTVSNWNLPINYGDPGSAWTNEARAYDNDTATYAYTAPAAGVWSDYLELYIPAMSCSQIRYWWSENVDNAVVNLEIDVYYNGTWNSVVSDDSQGEGAYATASLGGTYTVTAARVRMKLQGVNQARLNELHFYAAAAAYQGNYLKQVTFNSNEYLAWGNCLVKLDTNAGASFVLVAAFPQNITDVIASATSLYVYLGDTDNYWYVTPTTSSATLNEELDISETDVTVTDGTQFVNRDIIKIESEEMLVTGIATNVLTVIRGYGSTAATHSRYLADGTTKRPITTMRFVETTSDPGGLNATYGIWWDDKLFKIDSAGQLAYLTNPATATPTATANGLIPVDDNDLQRLSTYYNINGDDVIYASTKKGLWIHDYANAKWLQTQLKMPQHTNAGKGVCTWRDGLFISAGLDVLKYIPDVPAQIVSMGLDRDDGLPVEYAGEIMYMEPGYNELYAAVDASQVTGTGYSGIYGWDGRAWQCKWTDSTEDQAIYGMHVSSIYAYRLWFNAGSTVYYIPLHRNLRNPLKISTDTHALSSIHITPWFDASWEVGNKLAFRHVLNAGADVSADETIIAKYRLDHTYIDRDTGWTTMATIVTAGENSYTFGSSLGTAFKAIQFRYDLARAAGTNTETPDILYARLEYEKVLPIRWSYRFTVDCSQPYHGKSETQLLDAIVTAVELRTRVPFIFDNTTKYVEIKNVRCVRETGKTRIGEYEILCVET